MRPVNKGKSPYTKIKDYKEALPFLEEKLGSYCSYCEFPITHVPEVEHVVSKSCGGEKLSWSNLLLSCKYCNSTKRIRQLQKTLMIIYGRINIIRHWRFAMTMVFHR